MFGQPNVGVTMMNAEKTILAIDRLEAGGHATASDRRARKKALKILEASGRRLCVDNSGNVNYATDSSEDEDPENRRDAVLLVLMMFAYTAMAFVLLTLLSFAIRSIEV